MIRRARGADIPRLVELGRATFAEAFGHLYDPEDLETFLSQAHSEAKYGALLQAPDTAIWIAEDEEGKAVAYGVAGRCGLPVPQLEPTAGEIKRIYVHTSAQGRQLGSQLMDSMIAWLTGEGYAPLYVGVYCGNVGAQRLYERHGFVRVGEYRFPVGRKLDREFILKRVAPPA